MCHHVGLALIRLKLVEERGGNKKEAMNDKELKTKRGMTFITLSTRNLLLLFIV